MCGVWGVWYNQHLVPNSFYGGVHCTCSRLGWVHIFQLLIVVVELPMGCVLGQVVCIWIFLELGIVVVEDGIGIVVGIGILVVVRVVVVVCSCCGGGIVVVVGIGIVVEVRVVVMVCSCCGGRGCPVQGILALQFGIRCTRRWC